MNNARGSDLISFAIIILAAGLSERMGVFKPLLPVDGLPAVSRCVQTAEAAGIQDIYVVTGHKHAVVESAMRIYAPNAKLVRNDSYLDGMFTSACAGVSALPGEGGLEGFFLLPADCCAVSPGTFSKLMEVFAKKGGACVVRPQHDGKRGHPPLIPAGYINRLLSYNGENGLKGFLSPLLAAEAEIGSSEVLLDMDTPEDYAELLGFLGLATYPGPAQRAELFAKYATPPEIIEHGKHVAAVALKIARHMETQGESLDAALLESACLLHDISRMTADHARSGMELLLCEGYPKAAILVGRHMDLPKPETCGAQKTPPRPAPSHTTHPLQKPSLCPIISETELLYLADKLCRRGKFVTLEETMLEIEPRFAQDPDALATAKERINTAQAILDTLKERHGIGYGELSADI